MNMKKLNAFQLKSFALIIMTLDHVAVFLLGKSSGVPYDVCRTIGRIAAPIFLYLVADGLHHTRSKVRYALRLYIASVLTEITNSVLQHVFTPTFSDTLGNIFPTLFYVAWFVLFIDAIRDKKFLRGICGILLPFCISGLQYYLCEYAQDVSSWNSLSVLLPSALDVMYSGLFVLLGIIWHYVNNLQTNCLLFTVFSLLCWFVPGSAVFQLQVNLGGFLRPAFFSAYTLFQGSQWCMIFAVPSLLLYNGQEGPKHKFLFYTYYPLHQYLLYAIHLLLHT